MDALMNDFKNSVYDKNIIYPFSTNNGWKQLVQSVFTARNDKVLESCEYHYSYKVGVQEIFTLKKTYHYLAWYQYLCTSILNLAKIFSQTSWAFSSPINRCFNLVQLFSVQSHKTTQHLMRTDSNKLPYTKKYSSTPIFAIFASWGS